MKKVDFMLTAFRDGFQSVFGARVFSKDYLPVVEFAAKECGIRHLEAGGGAMFQSPIFYSRENAFDVMDAFRAAAGPDANLQTLARGISVVALKAQPRDVIKLHAEMFKKHGMTTIRNFDALNDVSNLIWSGQCIHDAGLRHEVTVTMMELPPGCEGAHDAAFYEETLKKILAAGIPYDSVCFKDASGTACPQKVFESVRRARKLLGKKTRLVFHSHDTAGTCVLAYKAAIEAGADQIDLSLAPVSGGTCQPDLITMWHALRGTDYTLDIDIEKIIKLSEMFKEAMKDYFMPPEATKVEPTIPFFPMPGGALTANTQMLRDNNLMDKYPQMIAAMGEAVRKGGFGTSVTPVSQFYFQQAFNNVMFGPWKRIADGYGRMVLGYFGRTPVPPDPEVVKAAAEQLKMEPTKDHLAAIEKDKKRGVAATRMILEKEGLPVTDENLFIVASCEEKGVAFLKGAGTTGVRKNEPAAAPAAAPKPAAGTGARFYKVSAGGQDLHVKLAGKRIEINGIDYDMEITRESAPPPRKSAQAKAAAATSSAAPAATSTRVEAAAPPPSGAYGGGTPVITPLPGLVLRIEKAVGAEVNPGETILVLESMKMETAMSSSVKGVIESIPVVLGQQVQAGTAVVIVR